MFDYRYSQLILVFAGLIRAGYIGEDRLDGLGAEKREAIRRLLRFSEDLDHPEG